MEENSSLFSLSIDPQTKEHLAETAKWARFLAIVGFVFLFIVFGYGIYSAMVISQIQEEFPGYGRSGFSAALGATAVVMYVLLFVLYFFPLLFTLRFANKMKVALYANNQVELNNSFQNLKILFRYLGIITIIALVLVGLSLFFGIVSRA